MKPWEEIWLYGHNEGAHFLSCAPQETTAVFGGADPEARARLASAAPDMARLLLSIEIVGDGAGYCPACGQLRPDEPHKDDCDWLMALRKAGVWS